MLFQEGEDIPVVHADTYTLFPAVVHSHSLILPRLHDHALAYENEHVMSRHVTVLNWMIETIDICTAIGSFARMKENSIKIGSMSTTIRL